MRRVLFSAADGKLHTNPPAAELKQALAKGEGTIWIDLQDADDRDWEYVLDLHAFHHLAVEDCRGRVQRPKVEEYPGHLLLVFHALNFTEQAAVLDTIELDTLLNAHMIVTVHDLPIRSVTEVRDRCEKSPDFIARGADYLLYAIIDRIVDYYFPIIDEFEDELDDFERRIFDDFDRHVYADIFAAKKRLLALRRFMAPQRETLSTLSFRALPGIGPHTQIFFRDVYDHSVRLHDSIETFRDLITGALDSYLSQVSNRMNEIMKVLTIVGTIMLPLSFLTGVFGMNFDMIPGLHDPNGFWYLLGGMAALSGAMIVYFKRRDWI